MHERSLLRAVTCKARSSTRLGAGLLRQRSYVELPYPCTAAA